MPGWHAASLNAAARPGSDRPVRTANVRLSPVWIAARLGDEASPTGGGARYFAAAARERSSCCSQGFQSMGPCSKRCFRLASTPPQAHSK